MQIPDSYNSSPTGAKNVKISLATLRSAGAMRLAFDHVKWLELSLSAT